MNVYNGKLKKDYFAFTFLGIVNLFFIGLISYFIGIVIIPDVKILYTLINNNFPLLAVYIPYYSLVLISFIVGYSLKPIISIVEKNREKRSYKKLVTRLAKEKDFLYYSVFNA